MERLISRLLQAAMRIAVVLMILAFIAFGMVGVYRVSKLSWRGHIGMWLTCSVSFLLYYWIFEATGSDYLIIMAGLVCFSGVSEALVWFYERLNIYDNLVGDMPADSDENKESNREWFFGLFSSLCILVFVFVGLYIWDGRDPFEVGYITHTWSSLLGFAMLCLGFGLPLIGFSASLFLQSNED